ncbi:hypothetical protein [Burkholderia cepacia]|uniref:hypothetical protein n=1 Tax=Burkholderia cepacia TaxID=292 RepID=UPI001CF21DD7|nr:hypothetical protein [Burkholderia cepacia]MCA8352996.1 hypothetical protein [Burkholderia cepacia]
MMMPQYVGVPCIRCRAAMGLVGLRSTNGSAGRKKCSCAAHHRFAISIPQVKSFDQNEK